MALVIDEAIAAVWNFGKEVAIELGGWLKDIVSFVFNNFHFTNPKHLFALAMVFLAMVVILIAAFGGGAAMIAGTADTGVGVGSGFVSTGSSSGDIGEGAQSDSSKVGQQNETTPEGQTGNVSTTLCGNHVCEKFNTSAKHAMFDTQPEYCSDMNIYYDIPPYCLAKEPLTILTSDTRRTLYASAFCGVHNTNDGLNQFCILNTDSDKILYYETQATCPVDCTPEYECSLDLTCDQSDNCDYNGFFCCSSGLWAGYCVDGESNADSCNDAGGANIVRSAYTLLQNKQIPNHCECTQDIDCTGEYESPSVCCGAGTLKEGFCYTSNCCNTTIGC